jgi:hypothetical protein
MIADGCFSCILFDDHRGRMFKDWLLIIEYSWLCILLGADTTVGFDWIQSIIMSNGAV